jgi:hypothetical protein
LRELALGIGKCVHGNVSRSAIMLIEIEIMGVLEERARERSIEAPYGTAPANWIDLESLLSIKSAIDHPRHQGTRVCCGWCVTSDLRRSDERSPPSGSGSESNEAETLTLRGPYTYTRSPPSGEIFVN